ncbi:MAG: hypothetical protein ACI9TV_002707 [Sulfurimonas sp.]|jgi:hypothetical protein
MAKNEYELEKRERERKDIKRSIIIFSMMAVSLVGSLIYLVVNR